MNDTLYCKCHYCPYTQEQKIEFVEGMFADRKLTESYIKVMGLAMVEHMRMMHHRAGSEFEPMKIPVVEFTKHRKPVEPRDPPGTKF